MPHLANVLCCAACHPWCCVDGSGSLAVKFLLSSGLGGADGPVRQQAAHYTVGIRGGPIGTWLAN